MVLTRYLAPVVGAALAILSPAAAAPTKDTVPVLEVRNAPGRSSRQTLQQISEALSRRDVNFTSGRHVLDRSWNGATLFKQEV